ncbi:metal-dependent hydrolase [Haliangium ochraceum]|nr:metal-dependent hydrolase [Haliangium ochraceum]
MTQPAHPLPTAALPRLRARHPKIAFADAVPRHWFGGLALPTHVANGVNLLFPAGERFFVRSVKHYLERFRDDPEMSAQIRGFFGQEGSHAREHERFFATMEAQGYEIRKFLEVYQHISFDIIEKAVPPVLRLATTAACEHFTALLAEVVFDNGALDKAHPLMRELLTWHAAEELEHKTVAFDVLKHVDARYSVRVGGLAIATALLAGWWVAATAMLLRQDRVPRAQRRRERSLMKGWRARPHSVARDIFARGIRDYLRRDFHPSDRPDPPQSAEYLRTAFPA